MHAVQTARVYTKRFLGLGWARVFLVLGIVFLLLSLANPIWAYTTPGPGTSTDTLTFGWTSWMRNRYESGAWAEAFSQSYTALAFDLHAIANAAGTSYILIVVLIFILIGAFALISSWFSLQLHGLSLLVLGLVVAILAFVALLYPVLTIPAAAAGDFGDASITGFWGGAGPTSWGAGLGWWFLLIGVLFGILGGIWPFLKSLREPMVRAPPPREWQVER